MPALATVQQVKDYLRLEDSDEAENRLVGELVKRAEALVRQYLRGRGWWIEETAKTYTLCPDRDAHGVGTSLLIPDTPVKLASPAPTVTGASGAVVSPTTYQVNPETGRIRGLVGATFADEPYAIAATVGLATAGDYAERIAPLLTAAVVDAAADFFQRRNPAAVSEGTGGGVSTQWASTQGLPTRTREMLDELGGIEAR